MVEDFMDSGLEDFVQKEGPNQIINLSWNNMQIM